jgi:tricarballylate dehydrogenase
MTPIELTTYAPDVLVVGGGNAALCSAISAHDEGARVLIIEAAPLEERAGNSFFTGGAFRFAYRGVEDLRQVTEIADAELENVDFGTYTEAQFLDDMYELTEYRTDPELCELLVKSSLETAKWVAKQGVKLHPGLGRQA